MVFHNILPVQSAPDKGKNIALTENGAAYEASSVPNPAWKPAYMGDDLLDTNHGWVGDIRDAPLVAHIRFPTAYIVGGLVFHQAGFREAETNRFARPGELRLTFDGGVTRDVTLKDAEGVPQRFDFDPVATTRITVEIRSVYSDGAKFPSLAGFQEIQALSAGPAPQQAPAFEPPAQTAAESPSPTQRAVVQVAPRTPAPDALPQVLPADDARNRDTYIIPPPALDMTGLDPDEQEILYLLQQLLIKLDAYMHRQHARKRQ